MKINRSWAMFDKMGMLSQWAIRSTRQRVIDRVEQTYGMKWRHLYKNRGFRIGKVVVLRAEDFEEFLAKQGGKP